MSWDLSYNQIRNTLPSLPEVFDTYGFIAAWEVISPDTVKEFELLRGRNWRAIVGRTLSKFSTETGLIKQCNPGKAPAVWRKKIASQSQPKQPIVQPKNELLQFYKILNCHENDSLEMITEKYKILIKKFHPDTVHNLGLDEDQMKLFNTKFHEIQTAYEKIKASRDI